MNYIICTNLIREKKKSNNIYLGDWALSDDDYLFFRSKKVKPFLWENKKNFIKDSLYIKKLCFKLYDIIYLSLNKTHRSSYSKKFWKILLFPWLYYYVTALYFRWNSIKVITKKNNTFIFKKNLKVNFNNFLLDEISLLDENWNQKLFQEIVNAQNKNYIFQKELNKTDYLYKNNFFPKKVFSFIPNFVFYILNFLISLLKKNEILFVNTCYPRTASFFLFKKYKLNSFLDFFLRNINPLFVYSGKSYFFLRKRFKFFFTKFYTSKDKFEIFLKSKISEDLPNYLHEDFNNYLNRYIKIKDSKIIITSYSLHSKFPNQFYIAEQVNKGSKLYLLEHGGSLITKREMLDLDTDIVDKKITWHKSLNLKHFQIPTHPFHYKNLIQENISNNNNKKSDCLIVGGGDFKHIWQCSYYLKGPQIIGQLQNIKNFYNFLDISIKKNTFVKPHEGYTSEATFNSLSNLSFDLIKFYKSIFKKNIIRNKSLEDCINNSRLVVCVYPETTFALSMYSSVPTILIYNKNHYIFHSKTNDLIKELVKNNIIFYNSKKAAKHINRIWQNPAEWYNSKEVTKVRNLFLKKALGIAFPRNFEEEKKNWKTILKL